MTDLSEQQLKALRLQATILQSQAAKKAAPPPGPQPDAQGVITLEDGTRMVLDPATGSYTNVDMMAGNMQPSALGALVSGAANGTTFGWGDELAGALGASPLAVERGRATTAAGMRDHPVAAITGNMAGGLAVAVPAMAAAPAGLTGGASVAGQTGAGMLWGGAMGALQGAGEANDGDRLRGAAIGGALGGVIGAAAPTLAAGLRAGSLKVISYLKSVDTTGIQKALGISKDAAEVVKAHLANDDVAAARAAMDKAGPDAMIADSSPQASQLLDSTVAAGGPAQRVARDAVEGRSAAAASNLTTTMDDILGAPQGVKSAARDIAAKTAASRKAAYDAAYASPIDYASPQGAAIEDVLGRIPSKTMNAAIQEANDAMKAAGIKNQQIMAQIAPDGSVTFTEMPNVQQLDALKKALGEVANAEKDQFGRLTGAGVRASKLASELKDAVGNAVPSYSTAVKLGGDKIAEDKALDVGRRFMSMSREDVVDAMKGASAEAQIAAKQGMRAAFDEAMANVKAAASDGNMDARQAMKVVKDLSSDANRAKAEAILGKVQADRLFAEFDKAGTQLALRTAIARNSATAARTAGKAAMDTIIRGGAAAALKRGEAINAAKRLTQILTRSTPADDLAREQAVYAEVAKALTEKRGLQAKSALEVVQSAIKGIPATNAQAQLVAKTITGLIASGSYQARSLIQNRSPSGTR